MFNICLLVLVFITNIYTCAGTHAKTHTHTHTHKDMPIHAFLGDSKSLRNTIVRLKEF